MSEYRVSGLLRYGVTANDSYHNRIVITSSGGIAPTSIYSIPIYIAYGESDVKILNNGEIQGSGGIGVDLNAGSLANYGTIEGGGGASDTDAFGAAGVFVRGGTLINSGSIRGGPSTWAYSKGDYSYGEPGGAGVDLSGGDLVNVDVIDGGVGVSTQFDCTAGIGGIGVGLYNGAILTNRGHIVGGQGGSDTQGDRKDFSGYYPAAAGGAGVVVAGGQLTNTGLITGGMGGSAERAIIHGGNGVAFGGYGGAGVDLYSGEVINRGVISGGEGGTGYGFYKAYGWAGGSGVYLDGGTLIDAGTIEGGKTGVPSGSSSPFYYADAVRFGSVASTLIVDPGAVFVGAVVAKTGVDDVLELAGTKPGTLSGLGTQFIDFTTITVDVGASWTLTDPGSLPATTSLTDDGDLLVRGSITLKGEVSGSGTLALAANATINAVGALGVANISFVDGGTAALDVHQPSLFTSIVSGFGSDDTIDLGSITATSLSFSDGTLTVFDGTTAVDQLMFAGSYSTDNFSHTPDDHGGTIIGFVAV